MQVVCGTMIVHPPWGIAHCTFIDPRGAWRVFLYPKLGPNLPTLVNAWCIVCQYTKLGYYIDQWSTTIHLSKTGRLGHMPHLVWCP